MMKSTPLKIKSKNFYLVVLEHIKNNYYPVQIANKFNISKQSMNYYISILKRHGCIRKISQGAWLYLKEYEPKRVKKINIGSLSQPILNSNKNEVRGHAFMFHLKVPYIRNWNNRRTYLDKHNIKYEKLYHGEKLLIKGRIVHLYSKSIIVYERESYISNLAKETKSLAIYHFLDIIKTVENQLKLSFEYKKKYQFKITREHYALMKNCMARQYNKEGKKLEVYNGKGLWLLIDNSFNLNEMETLKNRETVPNQAVLDNEGVQNYFNSHKRTNFQVTPEFILNTMNGIQQNQMVFDNNMKSHLDVLDKLSTAIDELRKEIKKKT